MSSFPLTSVSAIAAAVSSDPTERERGLDAIVRAYWKPAYKYLRLRWNLAREDAEDLTQDFFARAQERGTFARYDASLARFRTFLRTCLDSAAKNAHASANRLKRGGGALHSSLDAERELAGLAAPGDDEADEFFRREWLRALFELAVDDLRAHCEAMGKHAHWQAFERYDLAGTERPTYADLAALLGVPVTQVTNFLAFARREFRRILLDRLREQCATSAEYHDEARELLGKAIA